MTAAVTPTARGLAVFGAFVVAAIVGTVVGWFGLLPLLVAVGTVLLAGPPLALAQARRAGEVRVAVDPRPPVSPVGTPAVLAVRVAVAGGGATHRRAAPPIGAEMPDRRWRRGRGPALAARHDGRRRLAPGVGSVVRLPPDVDATWPVPTRRRGIVGLPPGRVWVHDPLGLFGAAVGTVDAVTVVVHPVPALPASLPWPPATATAPDRLTADPAAVALAAVSAVAPTGPTDGTGALSGLRPYRPGDRLHRLHWPSLALYDRLLVRCFDPEPAGPAVRLVIDDRAGVHRPADFEATLAAALALADRSVAAGTPVTLATLSGRSVAVPATAEGPILARTFVAGLAPRRPPGPGPMEGPAIGGGVEAVILTTATGAARLPSDRFPPARVIVVR
ncbi:MAG TPA: DUF58 domain-containing protein [Acidimicrobiales bacterium]|nr:DUF58 domain-containing protein [Acidimicrobiales bacterium]